MSLLTALQQAELDLLSSSHLPDKETKAQINEVVELGLNLGLPCVKPMLVGLTVICRLVGAGLKADGSKWNGMKFKRFSFEC